MAALLTEIGTWQSKFLNEIEMSDTITVEVEQLATKWLPPSVPFISGSTQYRFYTLKLATL